MWVPLILPDYKSLIAASEIMKILTKLYPTTEMQNITAQRDQQLISRSRKNRLK